MQMLRPPLKTTCTLSLLFLLASCRSPEKPPQSKAAPPQNLVLVTIDTLRADRLGCYGYTKGETPNLDRLAKAGALFENATTHAPLTAPSHASMFTGVYPTVHKVRDTGGFVLQEQSTTLAEVLQQQGWDTAAFVGASVLKKNFGFSQGFAVYDDTMPAQGSATSEFPERRAADVVDRAMQWLSGRPDGKPFFLWVHVFDPHGPYDPPSPFREKHNGRAYDGEVAYTDQQLGRLFEAVKSKSPDRTLIAVLSDHGESLADHGEYTHGVFLYDATLRIAFLLSGPGVPAGLRVKGQARAIDLTPTLFDQLGVKPPPGMQGASLVPALAGKPSPDAYSYSETVFSKLNMGWSELRAIRTDRWKYIRAPKPELYDLAKDVAETTNVLTSYPAVVEELEAKLKSIAAPGTEKVETQAVDRRTMDQLKSLGYLGGGPQAPLELTGKGIDPKDRVEVLRLLFSITPDSGVPASRRLELLRQAQTADPSRP
jgi:choline-sulfatase